MKNKAFCIMSGGIDSTLAAAITIEDDYGLVEGIFFNWGQKSLINEERAFLAICKCLGISACSI